MPFNFSPSNDARSLSDKAEVTTPASVADRAVRSMEDRPKRLLNMIQTEPAKAALSVRTRLNQDVVQWENALTFLSHKATTPEMGALMVLTGELIREGKLDQVFTEQDLADIASVSLSVWLRGQNDDLTHLRYMAADKLGALLDDSTREYDTRATLSGFKTKAKGGIPQPQVWYQEHKDNIQALCRHWVEEAYGNAPSPFGQENELTRLVPNHFSHPNWTDSLDDRDWKVLARLVPPGLTLNDQDTPVFKAVGEQVLTRLVQHTHFLLLAPAVARSMAEPETLVAPPEEGIDPSISKRLANLFRNS